MKYIDWLPTLTEQQLRALAAQCRILNWKTSELPKLRKRLLKSPEAKQVFKLNYGSEAEVSE